MFWFLFLALPVYAGAKAATLVGPQHGFLAGLGVMVAVMLAVLILQTALVYWLGAIAERWRKAHGDAVRPTAATAPPPIAQLPERNGGRARFRPLVLYGVDNRRQDATRLFYDLLKDMVARHASAEVEHDDSDAALPMVSTSEVAEALEGSGLSPEGVLVVFRSHDLAWVGFRCGNDSFRFRHRAVTEVTCSVVHPAKGSGGFGLAFRFASADRPADASGAYGSIAYYELPFGYHARHESVFASAVAEIAHMLEATLTSEAYADA